MRLLIADDDAALRALLRTTFEVVDVEVEEAATAEAALEAVVRERPDAIVLDFRFPGMSGIELCRRLKADEATTDIAIVLLSGSVGRHRRRPRLGRRRVPAKAVQPAGAARRRRAAHGWAGRRAAPGPRRGRGRGRAAAPPLRARPPPPPRDRARTAHPPPERVQGDRGGARQRARVQGHGDARALPAGAALRARALAVGRRRRSSTTRASSTASCSTTSARSGSPTASSRSRAR